jgi:UDP-N-acetylglucosamine/UDP-N-acetylgalactosamine 4-epimerase
MSNLPDFRNKKILVTGGAGFIGSNLIEALLQQGAQVVCLDNFSTGKKENIEEFLQHPKFQFIEGDIRNESDCLKATAGVDAILNQAAIGSVPRSIANPYFSHDNNVSGFLRILDAARENKVKRIVYASSSSVYGDHPTLPKVEDQIGNQLSPYAVTKYSNELYAGVYAKCYGMELIGLRYFNVFGRRQDPDSTYAAVIPKFVKSLIMGESPVINGDGSHSRDFTYIDNVIQFNLLAASTINPDAINTVYNVAVGDQANLSLLVELLKQNLSKFIPEVLDIPVINGPERAGDIRHSLASIQKAKELLGYEPTLDFEQGLEIATEWYYHHLKN